MVQDKHTATAAHLGAKVRTTNLLTHTHNTLKNSASPKAVQVEDWNSFTFTLDKDPIQCGNY